MSPLYLPLTEQLRQFSNGQLSPVTLMQQSLERIAKHNPTLNAFNFVFADTALAVKDVGAEISTMESSS